MRLLCRHVRRTLPGFWSIDPYWTIGARSPILSEITTIFRPIFTAILIAVVTAVALEARFIRPFASRRTIVRPAVGSIAVIRPVVAIIPVTEPIVLLAISPERPISTILIVAATIVIGVVIVAVAVEAAFLAVVLPERLWPLLLLSATLLLGANCNSRSTRLRSAAEILASVVSALVTVNFIAKFKPIRPRHTTWCTRGRLTWLLELLAIRHDDPVIMLGVLQIVLRQNSIARRLRITCERLIFLGDMGGCSADLHIGTVGFKTTRKWILSLAARVDRRTAVVVAVTVAIIAAATATILLMLTWSHWL